MIMSRMEAIRIENITVLLLTEKETDLQGKERKKIKENDYILSK